MRIAFNTYRKVSPEVGEVEFVIRKVTDDFFGGSYKDIKMSYMKNDRKVSRTFIIDECGRIKFKNACKKLGIAADYILAQVF